MNDAEVLDGFKSGQLYLSDEAVRLLEIVCTTEEETPDTSIGTLQWNACKRNILSKVRHLTGG